MSQSCHCGSQTLHGSNPIPVEDLTGLLHDRDHCETVEELKRGIEEHRAQSQARPKFYMLLRSYAENSTQHEVNYGYVYGPFTNNAEVDEDLARRHPNNKDLRVLVVEGDLRSVPPSPLERPESEKREPGNLDNYEMKDGKFFCKVCGSIIYEQRVAHPIHMKGTNNGFGECKYDNVPYCPNCDKKPSFSGVPVYV
jgi:hypothetical protein